MDYLLLRFGFKRFVLNPNKINPGDLLRSFISTTATKRILSQYRHHHCLLLIQIPARERKKHARNQFGQYKMTRIKY